jgi:hypothetical protein
MIIYQNTSAGWVLRVLMLTFLLTVGTFGISYAQTGDTTRTERQELQNEELLEETLDGSETPYQMDVLESDISRYQLRDYGSRSRFYRQLEYLTAEDFLMREEEGYQRYGEEWERKINEDLLKIIRATFKEDSEIMKLWKSIAPFLSFGIWEPYEVPITRVDHPNKVPIGEEE